MSCQSLSVKVAFDETRGSSVPASANADSENRRGAEETTVS